jgi:F-type H+-transporting ATPase subunit gamma
MQIVLRGAYPEILRQSPAGEKGITGMVIFGSDQGLCGSFNDQIASYAGEKIYQQPGAKSERIVIICVGSRLCATLEESGHPVERAFPVPNSPSGVVGAVQDILLALDEFRDQLQMNKVMLFYNALLTTVSYEPHMVKLLPPDREMLLSLSQKKWPTRILPSFTMDRQELFSAFIREYVFVVLFRAFAESMASENAARLASMQAAERNIEERLDELNALFRRKRQDLITSELLDIISGFEALQPSKAGW